ncbi:MAG: histidinol-phosphatase [Hyphomonadaceae bacterium]|nr:histidinol-phosphatase [Hyphomonadaceae bacterium]
MLSQAQTEEFLAFAGSLAETARGVILPYFRADHGLENKAARGFDPVTLADRAAEEALRARIEETYPEHGIIGEEYAEKPSRSGFSWVLDPIDGTRAFISGLPLWGVLIALSYEGKPLIGIMDQPYLGERFRGFPGGADLHTRDGVRPLKVRACEKLTDASISTTDVKLFTPAEAAGFEQVRAAAKLARYGCDCYAYCMVALGTLDAVIESGLKAWDIQALVPILEGAGGSVTDWRGRPSYDGGQVIASGDPRVRDEALVALRRAAA